MLDFINVKINLPLPVIAAWRAGGAHGTGFKWDGRNLLINADTGGEAVLENVRLKAGFKAPATFTFETINPDLLAKQKPGDTFAFDAFQEEVLQDGKTRKMGRFTHVIKIGTLPTPTCGINPVSGMSSC